MNLRSPTICAVCLGPICAGHKIRKVRVVHHVESYGVLRVYPDDEAAHVQCANPTLPWRYHELSRTKIPMSTQLVQLAPSHQCLNCGEVFRANDRILEVYVVEGAGVDPALGAPAIKCAGEAEYAHVDCRDRALSQGRATSILVSS